MSLTSVRNYFRDRLDGLGYEEYQDGFDFDNVGENIIDGLYHLQAGTITLNSQNQTVIDMTYPIAVRLYLHGYRDPASAVDSSIGAGEQIICDLVKVENAHQTNIKDVRFVSMEPLPKDVQQDNIILLEMFFDCQVVLDRR